MLFCQKRYRCQGAKVRDVFQERQADGTTAKQRGTHLPFTGKPPSRLNGRGKSAGKKQQKRARQKTAEGRREPEKRETTGRTKASVTKTDETTAAGIKTGRREKTGRTGNAGLRQTAKTDRKQEGRTEAGRKNRQNRKCRTKTGRKTRQNRKSRTKADRKTRQKTGGAGLRTGFAAAAKKQACAIAGPATRPEGRHTIFISAHPECASQRRESSYRPA